MGVEARDPEVMEYVSHLPAIEKKLPGDILHKVMFIWVFGYWLGVWRYQCYLL